MLLLKVIIVLLVVLSIADNAICVVKEFDAVVIQEDKNQTKQPKRILYHKIIFDFQDSDSIKSCTSQISLYGMFANFVVFWLWRNFL